MKKISAKLSSLLNTTHGREAENLILNHYLGLIGKYEGLLSDPVKVSSDGRWHEQHGTVHFQKQLSLLLKDLCSIGTPFWFSSACIWLVEKHQDRGELLLPGPRFNFHGAEKYTEGVEIPEEIAGATEPILLHSKEQLIKTGFLPQLEGVLDVPVAFIPLLKFQKRVGLLVISGKEGGAPPTPPDALFLRTLGSIIANAMDQWRWRFRSLAVAEMDGLFMCTSLTELWSRTAKVMKEYLSAEGCMVIWRPDPHTSEMYIVAEEGFEQRLTKYSYRVGTGQTGRCAEVGEPIRWDDVSRHRAAFDTELLEALEKSHGRPIHSWLAIPIGSAESNYGVIKVINRTLRSGWFTDEDVELGLSLALRLKVIIEKFIHIDKIEKATEEARRQSDLAQRQAKMAEEAARQRKDDLMMITHQLQGPLSSVVGAISFMQHKPLPKHIQERLEYIQDLVEDSLNLCYGTFTTFAKESGRESYFGIDNINAPGELRRLCERLKKTNARDDLSFQFREAPDFPTLRMDRNVFVSVFYSLIHNAMKYADECSTVILECSFERATGEAALKVKSIGEPIHPSESNLIFEKFKRGRVLEGSGRHHSGVGLGLWVARELMRAIGGELTVELTPNEPRLSVFVVHVPQTPNR